MTAIRPTTRICCHCGELVVVDLHARHRNLVVRRGCPECENLVKLRPVILQTPMWIVDGTPEPVVATEEISEHGCSRLEKQ